MKQWQIAQALIVFLIEWVSTLEAAHTDDFGEVIFANILYRHGERTPLKFMPNDPYSNETYWPEGLGQLTNEGKLHHFRLGKWLRKRYLHLIPQGKYSHDVVHVLSTDIERTLMSAQLNLAGMFPPVNGQKWGPLNWQPVPVHTVPSKSDKLLKMEAPCDKYDALNKEFRASKEFKTIIDEFKPLMDYCSQHLKVNITEIEKLNLINSDFIIEESRNLPLLDWTKLIFPQQLGKAAGVKFALSTWTTPMKRLRGGPLVKQMISNMEKKIKGESRSLAIYSGHDNTIAQTMNTMGIYDYKAPPFAAALIVELRKRHNNYFVTIWYKTNKGKHSHPRLMHMKGCYKGVCELQKFKTILAPVIPDDWDEECKLQE